jgi:dienelactone hydrolase
MLLLFCLMLSSVQCRQQKAASSAPSGSSYAASTGSAPAVALATGENVTFLTADGVRIAATWYPAGKKSGPAVICLHQWMSDRSSYAGLAARLVAAGISVLAVDMRGFGESVQDRDGRKVAPNRQAIPDLEAAFAYLKSRSDADPARLGIIGASYGASNAIIFAAKQPAVKLVVLLSPGLNFFNVLPTEDAVTRYAGRPLFSVASKEDMRSAEAVNRYRELAPKNHEILFLENAGHGTNMLAASEGLAAAITAFCGKNL